ncbi:MAG: KpsF/GutQ family sugar-phosphate isomerase [Leptotrichiaceae bacterium]|nr:KpsF/GutQ family sugar-phosphate isomerase [Leptotrichiaceae bacterium]
MCKLDILKEAGNVFDIEISQLEKVKGKIDDEFAKLAIMINSMGNNKVVITGIGKSGIIGKKIAATMASTGTTAIFINAAEALHGDLGMISKGDIVIAISNSGNSDEILSIMVPIKKIGAKIIAFTGNKSSALAKHAELVINIGIEKEANELGTAPMSSTTATLVMGDALSVVLMKMKNFTENDFAKYHPGGSLGKRLLLTVSDLMHTGEELPVLSENAEIENVLLVLTNKKMGAVCISETGRENGKLKGIITEGDIRRALVHKEKFFSYKAKDIMISTPISVDRNAMAMDALNLMENRKSQINVLPVVENENLVGIIRIHDLIGLR